MMKALADRGHEITVVSPNPLKVSTLTIKHFSKIIKYFISKEKYCTSLLLMSEGFVG